MKNLLVATLVTVVLVLLVMFVCYAVFAFALLQGNPLDWPQYFRVFYMFAVLVLVAIVIAFTG